MTQNGKKLETHRSTGAGPRIDAVLPPTWAAPVLALVPAVQLTSKAGKGRKGSATLARRARIESRANAPLFV